MNEEDINYRGFRLELRPLGKGCKVTIYRPGVNFGEDEMPHTFETGRSDQVVVEAMRIVDLLSRST